MSAATLLGAAKVLRHHIEFGNGAPPYAEALADWLEDEVHRAIYREDQQRINNATRVRPEPFPCYYDRSTEKALAVARAILGGAS